MVVQAAIAALPLIEPVARGALQLAQTPVLGWERVTSYAKGRKRPVFVVERSSVTVRAWEVAAAAAVIGAFVLAEAWLTGPGGVLKPEPTIVPGLCTTCIGIKTPLGCIGLLAPLPCPTPTP